MVGQAALVLSFIAPLMAVLSLQAALDARVAGAPGTGVAVGVIDHGAQHLYFAGSDGNGRPVDEHTLFQIGSVTKTFTATMLASMALRGQVRLTDPIDKYLPTGIRAPSKDGKSILLLVLAEQRSGLPRLPTNMNDGSDRDPYADYSVADMYAFLNGYALTRDPGSSYEYSNYGIGLLGQLLANRAKVDYSELMSRTVLEQLGMNGTALIMTGVPDPARLAVPHDPSGSAVTPWHFQSIAPAGGIASNLVDMLKYLRCNMGHGPLARDCLFAQKARAEGEPRHQIGLVWNVNSHNGIVSHDGATNGFYSMIAISRDHQTGVVAMSNGPAVADIATHALVASYPIASCPSTVPPDKTDPASYAGTYCNALTGTTFAVDTTANPNQLSIALLPQNPVDVPRTAPDTFSALAYRATFKFMRNRESIVGLWLMQYGQLIPAVRLDSQGKPLVARLEEPFPNAISLDPALLQKYVGTYSAAGIGTFTVTLQRDALYVKLNSQPALPVYASATDQFFYRVVDAQISFGRDPSGSVTSLTLHQNGQEVRATRTTP